MQDNKKTFKDNSTLFPKEHKTQNFNKRKLFTTTNIVKLALLSAFAFVLQLLEIKAIPFFPPWLALDFSDLPALLASFIFGPVSSIVVGFLKNLLTFIFMGSDTAGIGLVANFLGSVALCVPAGIIYGMKKTKKGAIFALIIGSVSFCVINIFLNIFLLMPIYMKAFGGDIILNMAKEINASWTNINNIVILGVTPFNLLKSILVSILTMLLYKPLLPLLNKK